MKYSVVLISFLVILQISGEMARPEQLNLPWSLINIWWDLEEMGEFKSIEIDFEVKDRVPRGLSIYIAPVGSLYLNEITSYAGVQPYTSGYLNKNEQDMSKRITLNTPGGVFSRWDERSPDAIRMAPGGFAESAGYEGNFISVRNKVPWSVGRYTIRVSESDRGMVNGVPHVWVKAQVRVSGKNYELGSLAFPGERLMITGSVSNFIEIYGNSYDTKDMPKLRFVFHWPRINGKRVKAKVWSGHQIGYPVYAKGRAKNGAVEVEIGKHFGTGGLEKGQVYWWEYLY